MPTFNYTGADAKTGADVQGTIEAPHERDAADMLRADGILPATIKPARTSAPGPSPRPPAPGAPQPPAASTRRASSTWATGIGGTLAVVLGVVAIAAIGGAVEWICAAVGLAFLGMGFLCLLHVVIVDAMQPKATRNMQAHQCQQLATIIEQNRRMIALRAQPNDHHATATPAAVTVDN
jgi:hypothetical protein